MAVLPRLSLVLLNARSHAYSSARKSSQTVVYSSAVIQFARNNDAAPSTAEAKRCREDYRVCYITRGKAMKAFAGAAAYPGGHIHAADFDNSIWGDAITQSEREKLKERFTSNQRLPAYSEFGNSSLLPEIGFRICALRELFEETGILFARQRGDTDTHAKLPSSELMKRFQNRNVSEWRTTISRDAAQFARFFREFDLVPAVDELIEWCAWFQPAFAATKRRFYTVFYANFSEEIQRSIDEHACNNASATEPMNQEVQRIDWWSPSETREHLVKREISLAPPQLYELARLFDKTAQRFDTLRDFAIRRERDGLSSMNSEITALGDDGLVITWNGDQRNSATAAKRRVDGAVPPSLNLIKDDAFRHRLYMRNNVGEFSVTIGRDDKEAPFQHIFPDGDVFGAFPMTIKTR